MHSTRPTRRRLTSILTGSIVAFLGAASSLSVHAQTVWDGSTDANWSVADNWSSGIEPTLADAVEFPNLVPATGATITLSAGEQAASLLFHNTYTLTGGDLTLGAATTVGVDATFTATISSLLAGAGTSLTKQGNGTLVLGGTNTYAGKTILQAGTLSISADANLGAAPGALVTDQFQLGGGTLKFTAGTTLAANRGFVSNAAGSIIDGNGLTNVFNGPVNLTGGTSSLLFTTSSGTATTFTLAASAPSNAPATAAVTVDSNVTLNLGSNSTAGNIGGNTATMTINAGGILRFNRSNATSYNADITGAGAVTVANNSGQALTLNPTVANTYSGGTNINGSNASVLGTKDSAFGSGPINFTASAGTVASSSSTARNFGNNIFLQGAAGTATFGQSSGGTGALTFGSLNLDRVASATTRTVSTVVATTFTAINDSGAGALPANLAFSSGGARNIIGAGNFSGNLSWNTGLVNVAGSTASIASMAVITQGDNGGADETATFGAALVGGLGETFSTAGGLNRIGDTATYAFNGTGAFTYNGANATSTGNTETIGTVSMPSGRAYLTLNASSDAPLGLVATTLNRTAATTMLVRANGLGAAGNGSSTFVIGNAASLLSGGGGAAGSTNISIIPWAVGDTNSAGGGSGFLTHEAATGLRLLAANEYDSTIAGAGQLRNVLAAGGETVNDSVTINSLSLSGGTTTIGNGVRVRPASGAVLLSGAGATLAGPGILEFGAGEGIINVANAAAITPTVSARLSGTAGLTFAGSQTSATTNQVLLLSGDNIATGTYTINTGLTLRLGSSAALNDNSLATVALKPQSILQINGNNASVRNFALVGFSGTVQNNAATDATLTAYQLAGQTLSTGTFINNGSTGKLNLVLAGNSANTTTISNSSGNYSYTGTTEVRTGTVNVTGSSAGFLSGTTGVIVNGGTFQLTNTTGTSNQTARLNDAATVTLNNGTFDFNNNAGASTNYAETVGGLTLNSGTNIVTVDRATSGQTSTMTFASLARNPGAWVLFNSQANGTAEYTVVLGTTTQSKLAITAAPTLDDSVIGGWALFDTSATTRNFATYASGSVTNLTGQVTTLTSGASQTQNVSITAAPAALSSNTQINSLVVTQSAATPIALGGNTLRVESGGVIAQGAFTATFSGGTLTAGTGDNANGELIAHVNTGATVTVDSTAGIANNGAGVVSLTKTGVGTLDLTGATNTYSGKTFISGGTLKASSDATLGTAPGAFVADAIVFSNGSILDFTAAPTSFTLNANRGITVGANTNVGGANLISIPAGTAGNGKTLTYNGAISQLGTTEGSLTLKSNLTTTNLDPGKFVGTLSSLNLGGTFRFESGTISAGGANSIIGRSLQVGVEGPASLTYTGSGGSLRIGAGVTGDVLEIGIVNTDPTPSNTTIGTSTLDVSALANFTASVDTIRLGVGNTNRTSRGNFVGATNNDITAATSILVSRSAGASQVGQNSSMTFGSGVNNITTPLMSVGELKGDGTVTVAAGGTLNLSGFAANTMTMYVGRNNGSTGTIAVGNFNGTGGTVNASFNNLIIAEKTSAGAGAASGTFTVTGTGNNISANSVTVSNITGNNAASTAANVGTLNFGGGIFTVNNDVALASYSTNTGSTPTSTGKLNITGGTFNVGGNITRTTDNETLSNSFVNVDGGTLNGLNPLAGDTTLATITASQLAFRSGSITNVANATLRATSSTNSGVAGTTGDALILRDTTVNFPVTLAGASGGNVHYEAAGAGTGATISGPIDLGSVGRAVNVENSVTAAADLTISGGISGNVLLTKIGTGTLLLNNTVAGSVTASAGILGGTGSIAGAVNIDANATLAPGASLGTLATGSLTFAATSTFALEIRTNGTPASDLASVNGILSLDTTTAPILTISDLNPAAFTSGSLPFITYSSWNGGFFQVGGTIIHDDAETFMVAGNAYQLDYDAGGNSVALIAVPEPAAVASLLGGLGVLLGLRRSRRR